MDENLQRAEFRPCEPMASQPVDTAKMAQKTNILHKILITGESSINSIKEITGISHYHLTRLKKRLLKG